MQKFDVVIIGGGPAGLACAEQTAKRGANTLLLERKSTIGQKVCAGGITWNGLVKRFDDLSQRKFSTQHIYTRHQHIVIDEPFPIIATVNRVALGKAMAEKAINSGTVVLNDAVVTEIGDNFLQYKKSNSNKTSKISFNYLVGADGSTSIVRSFLKLPVTDYGVGINYQIPGNYERMEWHLNSKLFGSGYAWIFPHLDSFSIGAYANPKQTSPKTLGKNLLEWCVTNDISIGDAKIEAEKINYDFRGFKFGNIFLAGDAAGLASGLTGEGIFPAIVSGEEIGKLIVSPTHDRAIINNLIKNHKRHSRAVKFASTGRFISAILAELTGFCLKRKIVHFSAAEMAR